MTSLGTENIRNLALYSCAAYNFSFVVFHAFFWKLFRWKADLRALTPVNRGIMQVLNLRLIYVFAGFSGIALFLAGEPVLNGLEKGILLFIAGFWLLRCIEQIIFFDRKNTGSLAITVVFLLGCALHLLPALQ